MPDFKKQTHYKPRPFAIEHQDYNNYSIATISRAIMVGLLIKSSLEIY
jgi:hypothetical protein